MVGLTSDGSCNRTGPFQDWIARMHQDNVGQSKSQLGLVIEEWRAAWRPGFASLIGGSLSYSLYMTMSSLFVEPLQDAFGWSRGEIAVANYAGLITAFAAPLVGGLVDRLGVKPVLLTGLLMTSLCYVFLSLVGGSLGYYYATYFLLNLFGMATTGITFTRIITGAFHRTRGTALALARSGLAIAGALMPLLLYPMIATFGPMGGFLTLGAFVLFVSTPLVFFWVPHQKNARAEISIVKELSDRWKVLLSQPKVRIICLAAMLNYAPVVAIMTQLKPMGVEKGLEPAMAVGAVSLLGMAAAAGALLSGVLVDRFWAPAVAFTLNILPAIGCLVLLQADVPPALFYGSVILIGLGQGAEIDIVAFMIARYFGLNSYSSIYGLSTMCIALGVAVGSSLIGQAYDLFGNYNIALICCSISFALAAVFYLAMGRYPNEYRPAGAQTAS